MKTVLLPVHPNWLELILSGEKTVEVRKTKPREAAPFRVLLYCTKNPLELAKDKNGNIVFLSRNKKADISDLEILSGKVIGEFVCDHIQKYFYHSDILYGIDNPNEYGKEIREKSCLTLWDFMDYLNGKDGYGWHISDLVTYDKPKELSEFGLKRAPQSWCYVEGGE